MASPGCLCLTLSSTLAGGTARVPFTSTHCFSPASPGSPGPVKGLFLLDPVKLSQAMRSGPAEWAFLLTPRPPPALPSLIHSPPHTHFPHLPLGCHWVGPKGCEQKRLEDLPAKTKHSGVSFSPLRHSKTHLGWRVLRHPEAISEGRGAGAARDGHPA